jgi:type 1 glutamine amidotransferase
VFQPFRVRATLSIVLTVAVLLPATACNAWRVMFPSRVYETQPPALPETMAETSVLLFTKTNGYRHHEAIEAGVPFFEALAKERGWTLFHTENGAVHSPELLARFDAVVWFQTSGDTLDAAQRAALQDWIEDGGGFVAVHGAGGDLSYDWRWYVEQLIGAQFVGHIMNPQFQEAKLVVEDRSHPATAKLPASFQHTEEWYSFEASPRARDARILATVDESTYQLDLGWIGWFRDGQLEMGSDHPVVWSHCPGAGRALFSALGHLAAAYDVPEHRALLEGAVAWAAGLHGRECSHPLAPLR